MSISLEIYIQIVIQVCEEKKKPCSHLQDLQILPPMHHFQVIIRGWLLYRNEGGEVEEIASGIQGKQWRSWRREQPAQTEKGHNRKAPKGMPLGKLDWWIT